MIKANEMDYFSTLFGKELDGTGLVVLKVGLQSDLAIRQAT
jgi:hypothetical protein